MLENARACSAMRFVGVMCVFCLGYCFCSVVFDFCCLCCQMARLSHVAAKSDVTIVDTGVTQATIVAPVASVQHEASDDACVWSDRFPVQSPWQLLYALQTLDKLLHTGPSTRHVSSHRYRLLSCHLVHSLWLLCALRWTCILSNTTTCIASSHVCLYLRRCLL